MSAACEIVGRVSTELASELRTIAQRLREAEANGNDPGITEPLHALEIAAEALGKSWSGSNMGYQSRVYYAAFEVPPPGAHFDSEWGFLGRLQDTTGEWREYQTDAVTELIYDAAGVGNIDHAQEAASQARPVWQNARPEVVSVFNAFLVGSEDPLLRQLLEEAEGLKDLSVRDAERALVGPIGSRMVRDTTALNQGFMAAPHQQVVARVIAIRSIFGACRSLAAIAERGASHMERLEASQRSRGQQPLAAGERVFIGHGRSLLWRELKDFLSDRLRLPWDEFNRVPVAGFTNIARLSEMLDNAGIAFVVLTAEDETTDGTERARQNVVHEAGLFQGRLGFARAIILLEDGCEEFSNIAGLGQIRFPRGQISGAFDEVRQVLEREGFVET
jgi:predicted nucleotide-binding protein